MNKDGHDGNNRFRDYSISLRQNKNDYFKELEEGFAEEPVLSATRTEQFWGGLYTRWLVQGPCRLTFEANRNYSFNTIVAALMLDPLEELAPPYYLRHEEFRDKEKRRSFESEHLAQSEGAHPALKPAVEALEAP